jgi:hypothetical protein
MEYGPNSAQPITIPTPPKTNPAFTQKRKITTTRVL